jgi:phosphate transport system substrate-binding protein
VALFLGLTLALLTACGQPPETPPAPNLVRLTGSTTMQPLLHALTAAYSELHPQVTFSISAVGSSAGLEQLRRGNADLALVSRELRPEEEHDAQSGQRLLAYTVIAYDGIAVVVHQANPISNLTLYETRRILSGQSTKWEEVGGAPEQVVVISREDGSGTRTVFEELVMSSRQVTAMAPIMPGSEAVRDYVTTHSGAVGYLSVSLLQTGPKALSIEGVSPSRQTVEDGSYGIVRPFLLVSRPEPDAEVAAFMRFARSPTAQTIVRREYVGGRSAPR